MILLILKLQNYFRMNLIILSLFISSFPCPSDTFLISKFPDHLSRGGYYDLLTQLVMPPYVERDCANQKVMLIGKSQFIDMSYLRAYRDSMFGKPGYEARQTNYQDHCSFTVNKVLIWIEKKKKWKVLYRRNSKKTEW